MIDYDAIAQLSELDAKLVRIITTAKGALKAVQLEPDVCLLHDCKEGTPCCAASDALDEIAKIEGD